jgi:hypothetical protein
MTNPQDEAESDADLAQLVIAQGPLHLSIAALTGD